MTRTDDETGIKTTNTTIKRSYLTKPKSPIGSLDERPEGATHYKITKIEKESPDGSIQLVADTKETYFENGAVKREDRFKLTAPQGGINVLRKMEPH
jgi:hypothetical protein